MAVAAREAASEIRPNVGTPRSLVIRLAQRFGRTHAAISLLAALSRATGLWEPSALSPASPPGCSRVGDLGGLLFAAWRRGGAWDEARPEPDVLRAAPDQRDASPSRALREIVLEALAELGEDSWLPWSALEGYLAADPRLEATERLFKRWAERTGLTAPAPIDVARRMVLETLPALGVLDIGADTDVLLERTSGSSDAFEPGVVETLTLRITARGRAYLSRSGDGRDTPPARGSDRGASEGRLFDGHASDVRRKPVEQEAPRAPSRSYTPSRFSESHVLTVGSAATIAAVLGLAILADLGRVEDSLDLVLSPGAVGRAISGGLLADEIRERVEAVAPLPESLAQLLAQASAVVGKATYAPSSGFLWVDDPDVRELLRTRKPTADLFVDPSPPGGLLLAPEVDMEKIVRRCRAVGVEVEGVVLVRAQPRPASQQRPQVAERGSQRPPPRGRSMTPVRTRTPFGRSR
jgi:hypothetical protein